MDSAPELIKLRDVKVDFLYDYLWLKKHAMNIFHKTCFQEVQLPFDREPWGPAGQAWQHHTSSLPIYTLPCVQNPQRMKKVFSLAQTTLLSMQLSWWCGKIICRWMYSCDTTPGVCIGICTEQRPSACSATASYTSQLKQGKCWRRKSQC